jgi:hypothetical protein
MLLLGEVLSQILCRVDVDQVVDIDLRNCGLLKEETNVVTKIHK